MKRLPLLVTVLAVAALSASLAYWGLQLFKPQQRPIAAVPMQAAPEANIDAAKGLFGGQIAAAVVSNYQLKGVVAANGPDSAAIIAADGKPAMAYGVGREVAPGVTIKEVHPKYVLLSEGGAVKRIDLPSDAGVRSEPAPNLLAAPLPQIQPAPQPSPVVMPQPQSFTSAPPAQPMPLPGGVPAPALQPGPVSSTVKAPAAPVVSDPGRQ
jgi:general secretion pathway protein C